MIVIIAVTIIWLREYELNAAIRAITLV